MGSKKKVTIGYTYYLDMHMGLCRGPVDALVQINVGEKQAFGKGAPAGNVTSPFSGDTLYINKPTLFGGQKQEGGIQGLFYWLTGEPAQTAPAPLKKLLGDLAPAFRGVCTAFYSGMVSSMNPYPKPWTFRVRRALKGWDNNDVWYPQKALIALEGGDIAAMNGAHILLECQTNRDWGRGKPRALLDLASYQKAADTLHAEGFGLCLKWRRTDDIARFENLLLEHIGAAHYLSRTTGLWTLRLIRDDYQKQDLPLFKYGSGLLAIDEQKSPAADSAANQLIVKYTDPRDGKARQTRAKNLGAMQQAGGAITTSSDYPGIPTASLAARVAARDCFAATAELRRLKVRMDRRAATLNPADVIRIDAQGRGIIDTVFRVGTIDYGSLSSGEITLALVEDLFFMPDEGTGDIQTPIAPPAVKAEPVTLRRLFEANWYDLASNLNPADLAQVEETQGALAVLAARPSGSQRNYQLQTRVGGAAFEDNQSGDFCPHARLVAAMAQGAAPVTVALMDTVDLDVAHLKSGDALLIDDELLRLQAWNMTAGTVTLARGCADSVPAAHESGARVWFIEDNACLTDASYLSGESVQARLLTQTAHDILEAHLAPMDSLTFSARQNRPYPPGNLRINGAAYPQSISGALTLSWASRNRLLQADQLHDTQVGSITSEENVTYSLRVFGETGALRLSVDNLTTTAYTWTEADEKAASNLQDQDGNPRLNASLRIELWSVRDGIASAQKHNFTVTRNLP